MNWGLHDIKAVEGFKKRSYLASGGSRDVYKSRNGLFVVKVPRSSRWDALANHVEAQLYAESKGGTHPRGMPLARCRLVPGTDILVMEAVTPLERGDEYPDWVRNFDTDGKQIGRTRDGDVVSYDYGHLEEWVSDDFLEAFAVDWEARQQKQLQAA